MNKSKYSNYNSLVEIKWNWVKIIKYLLCFHRYYYYFIFVYIDKFEPHQKIVDTLKVSSISNDQNYKQSHF